MDFFLNFGHEHAQSISLNLTKFLSFLELVECSNYSLFFHRKILETQINGKLFICLIKEHLLNDDRKKSRKVVIVLVRYTGDGMKGLMKPFLFTTSVWKIMEIL